VKYVLTGPQEILTPPLESTLRFGRRLHETSNETRLDHRAIGFFHSLKRAFLTVRNLLN